MTEEKQEITNHSQRLYTAARQIESGIESLLRDNAELKAVNETLTHELHKALKRIDTYIKELEEIRKYHAGTHN